MDEEDFLEMGTEIIPDLVEIYKREKDVGTRAFLVEAINRFQHPDVIPFLREALFDEEPLILEKVLNGLIMVACPEAVQAFTFGSNSYISREATDGEVPMLVGGGDHKGRRGDSTAGQPNSYNIRGINERRGRCMGTG